MMPAPHSTWRQRESGLYVPELAAELSAPRGGNVGAFALRAFQRNAGKGVPPVPPGPTPPAVTNLQLFLWYDRGLTVGDTVSGTGGNLQNFIPLMQLNKSAAFPTANAGYGQTMTLAGGNVANRGDFATVNNPNTDQIQWNNAIGVAEGTYSGTYRLQGRVAQWLDQVFGRIIAPLNTRSLAIRDNLAGYVGRKLIAAIGSSLDSRSGLIDAAVAGLWNGPNQNISVCVRVMTPAAWSDCALFYISRADGASRISLENNAGAGVRLVRRAASAMTTQTVASVLPSAGTIFTMGAKFANATGIMTAYIDGLPIGTAAAGTSRSPASLDRLVVGPIGAPASPVYEFGVALGNAVWTDAEFLAVHNSFLAYQAAPL